MEYSEHDNQRFVEEMASCVNQNLGFPFSQSSDGNNPICCMCTCRDCMREFHSLFNLSVHRELHCKKPREYFKWEKKYVKLSDSHMHYITHEMNNECKICGYKFSLPYLLRKHVELHKGAYNCTRCRKLFADSHSLIEHRKTVHNKEKIFKCVKCPRSYTLNSSLKRHMKDKHEPNNEVCVVIRLNQPTSST